MDSGAEETIREWMIWEGDSQLLILDTGEIISIQEGDELLVEMPDDGAWVEFWAHRVRVVH